MSNNDIKPGVKKNNRNLVYAGIAIVVVIVLLIILKSTGAIGNDSSIEVQTEKVKKRDIQEIITASGKVKPEKEVSISPDVSGEIIELNVKEGDRVKKGEVLLRIKPDEYQSDIQEAEAGYNGAVSSLENTKALQEQSQAQFNQAETLYKRYVVLKQNNAISSSDFEKVEMQYLSAKAQLESAKQGVLGARYNVKSAEARKKKTYEYLYKTTILCPIDGIVTKLNNQLGERVVGTMQMMGSVIMKVADLSKMIVDVDVNENDIIRLNKGDTADVEVDAFTGKKFLGVVTDIANSSKDETSGLSEQATNFQVKIKILESSYRNLIDSSNSLLSPFHPGMSALVDIRSSKVTGVLTVPILAVTNRVKPEYQDKSKKPGKVEDESDNGVTDRAKKRIIVFVYKNGTAVIREVVTGIQDDTYIEIKKGLSEGDEIVSGPYSIISKTLKDGKQVKRSNKPRKKENSSSR